ncbi:methyltransferase domain-containing protein, partial [Lactarius pseudohatsudake]
DFFIPFFRCPHHVERVGVLGDGSKWVCGMERIARPEKCVINSFGINGESRFEAALLERVPGCEVEVWGYNLGYNYSVNSLGPEIIGDPELRDRTHFKPFALGGTNSHADHDDPKYWTLESLMDLNGTWFSGHTFIDILKIDIEGGEFDALSALLSACTAEGNVLPVGQLQLEIHAREGREIFEYFARWWVALEAAGLRPFWTEPNLVYINSTLATGSTVCRSSGFTRRRLFARRGGMTSSLSSSRRESRPDSKTWAIRTPDARSWASCSFYHHWTFLSVLTASSIRCPAPLFLGLTDLSSVHALLLSALAL